MPFGQIPLSSPLKNPEPRRWIVITLKALPKKNYIQMVKPLVAYQKRWVLQKHLTMCMQFEIEL